MAYEFLGQPMGYPAAPMRDRKLRWMVDTIGLQSFGTESLAQRWEMDVNLLPDGLGQDALGAKIGVHQSKHGHHLAFPVPVMQRLGLRAPALAGSPLPTAFVTPDAVSLARTIRVLGAATAFGGKVLLTWEQPAAWQDGDTYQWRVSPTINPVAYGAWQDGDATPQALIAVAPGTSVYVQLRTKRPKTATTYDYSAASRVAVTVPQAAQSNFVKLAAPAAAGESIVQIKLEAAGESIIPAGWFISFAGHTKVYQVMEDAKATSTPSAGRRMVLYPMLHRAAAADSPVNLHPEMYCKWARDTQFDVQYAAKSVYAPTCYFVEAV